MKRLGKRLLAGPYLIWMLLFTVVPLVLLVYNAFTGADGSFTLSYVDEFHAENIGMAIDLIKQRNIKSNFNNAWLWKGTSDEYDLGSHSGNRI